MRNKGNLPPFIANMTYQQYAIAASANSGPSFGAGHDVHISDNAAGNQRSYSNFGHSYKPPSGTVNYLLAGSYHFTPTEVEVFV